MRTKEKNRVFPTRQAGEILIFLARTAPISYKDIAMNRIYRDRVRKVQRLELGSKSKASDELQELSSDSRS
ncbi:MAG: hypothetical protein WCQ57_13110 [Verrucomicrobiota bacterium]